METPSGDDLAAAADEKLRRAGLAASMARADSRAGRLTRLESAWSGSVRDLLAWLSQDERDSDILSIEEGGKVFLFSSLWMTPFYATLAARAEEGSLTAAVAEVVRHDSRVYPRPTPVTVFEGPPFNLAPGALDAALVAVAANPSCGDIKRVQASDGSVFLYSSDTLSAEQAASRAEWFAVGRYENP